MKRLSLERTADDITLIQELPDVTGNATAVFITSRRGTEHRPR